MGQSFGAMDVHMMPNNLERHSSACTVASGRNEGVVGGSR
jgi:hypothetical protein